MASRLWESPPRCAEPSAISELTLDAKLLKHGLCSADGDGDDLGSVEAGDPCRLGGEELRRLAVSESLCAASSDLTPLSGALMSPLRFLFLLKLPLSNIFSQLGSSVQ